MLKRWLTIRVYWAYIKILHGREKRYSCVCVCKSKYNAQQSHVTMKLMSQPWSHVMGFQLWFCLPPRYTALHCHEISGQARRADRVVVARSRPLHAHRMREKLMQHLIHASHCGCIVLIVLLADQWRQSLVKDLSRGAPCLQLLRTLVACQTSQTLSSNFFLLSLSNIWYQ